MAAAVPALITVAASLFGSKMQEQQQQKQYNQQLAAQQQERADAARIQAESQATASDALQAQQQESQKAFAQRLGNREDLMRQQLSRQNLEGTPLGQAQLSGLQREGVRASDELASNLAAQQDALRQKALFALPGLSARQSSLEASLTSPKAALYGDLASLAGGEFGRTMAGTSPLNSLFGRNASGAKRQNTGVFSGFGKTTGGINPSAGSPLPSNPQRDIFGR